MLTPEYVIELIQTLVSPQGCPWDRKQTPHSLADYLLEETFELLEAIRSEDSEDIKEEMGDVFFLLFFVCELMQEDTDTFLQEVWENSRQKMIRRHPHVFNQEQVADVDQIHKKWEEIKQQEKREKDRGNKDSNNPFASLPDSLPPLLKAYRLNSKAEKAGFTWPDNESQKQAVQKEWEEWEKARKEGAQQEMEEEFGDLLFSLIEQGRRQGIKANGALQLANRKFQDRVEAMLTRAEQRGLDWYSLDMQEKEKLWEEVKAGEGAADKDSE